MFVKRQQIIARNHCTNVTRLAKRNFEKLIVKDIKTNTKGFWSYVREQTKTSTKMSDLKDERGQLVMDSTEKANLLNNFFVSIFVSEPPGPLPIFDIRYNGTPVTKLSVDQSTVCKQLKDFCFQIYGPRWVSSSCLKGSGRNTQ